MTLADTAGLVASLELKDKFTKPLTNAERALGSFEKRASGLGAIGGHVKQGLTTATRNVELLGLAAGTFLVSQVKFGIDSLQRLDDVVTQTNAVLRSTGGVAGETADDIRNLANKYEDLNATIDDKVIQSGENLLLTFTNIRKDAFEPALKAALDMNQAMGGGEAGLQGTIQKLGKALNDPVKGLALLGRAGITFSAQQKAQIADLVKHNKLFEAQKVILAELTKRFGGSFAAAGNTATATFAKLGDAGEDLQMALAEGVLPALVDVAKEANTFLRDPSTIAAVKGFGKGLGDAFKGAVTFAKQVPWKEIGDGLRTAASAAGTLIGKFLDAPEWLKTAVITGWGLNKLTGGALTSIGGDIAKAFGDQFLGRGSSAANPVWVQQVAGAAAGVAGATGEGLLARFGLTTAVLGGLTVGVMAAIGLGELLNDALTKRGQTFDQANQQLGKSGITLSTTAVSTSDQLAPGRQVVHAGKGASLLILGTGPSSAANPATFQDAFGTGTGESQMAGWAAGHSAAAGFLSAADAAKQFAAALASTAKTIEDRWFAAIGGIKGVTDRSRAAFGKDPTKTQAAATLRRDELHHLAVIEKSNLDNATKLARLKALSEDIRAHGDTKTAAKVDGAIKDMKARIAAGQAATTAAVNTGTQTLDQAIAASKSPIYITLNTSVSASDVVKTTTKVQRYSSPDDRTKL